MPKQPTNNCSRYDKQRASVTVPVVGIGVLRKAKGLTLQAVCDYINEEYAFPKPVVRGTISAIELGHRGASAQMLRAYADALGISASDIDTAYEPRQRRESVA